MSEGRRGSGSHGSTTRMIESVLMFGKTAAMENENDSGVAGSSGMASASELSAAIAMLLS